MPTSFLSKLTYKRPATARGAQRTDGREPYCQNCEKYGKWTYECKGAECKKEYKSRPSRTKMLQNPKLQPKLTSKTVDNETTVTGIEAPAKKRRVEAEGAAKVDTDSDSSSSSSSSESDSSSSSDSDSSSDSSDSSSSSDSDNSSSDSSSSSSGSSSSSSDSDDGARKRKRKTKTKTKTKTKADTKKSAK